MIVYNVERNFFDKKSDAETARKAAGLKPAATLKIEVRNRVELAALLNQLCALRSPAGEPAPSLPAVDECVDVPKFIRDGWAKLKS